MVWSSPYVRKNLSPQRPSLDTSGHAREMAARVRYSHELGIVGKANPEEAARRCPDSNSIVSQRTATRDSPTSGPFVFR
jgi:hypothetical protein